MEKKAVAPSLLIRHNASISTNQAVKSIKRRDKSEDKKQSATLIAAKHQPSTKDSYRGRRRWGTAEKRAPSIQIQCNSSRSLLCPLLTVCEWVWCFRLGFWGIRLPARILSKQSSERSVHLGFHHEGSILLRLALGLARDGRNVILNRILAIWSPHNCTRIKSNRNLVEMLAHLRYLKDSLNFAK